MNFLEDLSALQLVAVLADLELLHELLVLQGDEGRGHPAKRGETNLRRCSFSRFAEARLIFLSHTKK